MKLTLAGAVAVAALVALQGAAAAELPSRPAKPEPAAKKCRIDGQDGVVLPGSATCVRLSGSISAGASFGAAGKSRSTP